VFGCFGTWNAVRSANSGVLNPSTVVLSLGVVAVLSTRERVTWVSRVIIQISVVDCSDIIAFTFTKLPVVCGTTDVARPFVCDGIIIAIPTTPSNVLTRRTTFCSVTSTSQCLFDAFFVVLHVFIDFGILFGLFFVFLFLLSFLLG
jgi:hypothetical protein